MSTITTIAHAAFAKDVRSIALKEQFSVMVGKQKNEFYVFNTYMILSVLEWNDIEEYLSEDDVDRLEAILTKGSISPCNCT